MKDLYICTGQYHVFCSLTLKLLDNADHKGDLLICDCFEGAKNLYSKLCSEAKRDNNISLFDSVYILDNQQYNMLNTWNISNRTKKIINKTTERFKKVRNTLEGILNDSYSRIFIAGPVPSLVEYCLYEYRMNKCEIFLFDDGLGSRVQWKEPNILGSMIYDYRRLEFFKALKGKFFYSPNRVCDVFPYIPVLKQCKPNREQIEKQGRDYDLFTQNINSIYCYFALKDPLMDIDVVYYSAGYDLYDRFLQYSEIECKIINRISKLPLKVAVKRHPNSKEEYIGDISKMPSSLPELSFLNLEIENKLLISSASATVFNPSFIFDKNPFVILTYRLFSNDDRFARDLFLCTREEMDRKIERTLFSGYADHTKIYIPNTFEELDEAIADYQRRSKRI